MNFFGVFIGFFFFCVDFEVKENLFLFVKYGVDVNIFGKNGNMFFFIVMNEGLF